MYAKFLKHCTDFKKQKRFKKQRGKKISEVWKERTEHSKMLENNRSHVI